MSLSSEITLKWGDGEYAFALKLKQLEELQKLCDAGLGEITARVLGGAFYIGDIYHAIRLALIGGGMAPVEAKRLVDLYVDGCPVAPENDPSGPLQTVQAVLFAVYYGFDELAASQDDPPGKAEAETATAEVGSTSPGSEPRPSRSAGPRKRSAEPASTRR